MTPTTILPLLQTILSQQMEIYSRLCTLNSMLSKPREPIKPKLVKILSPLDQSINDSLGITADAGL